MNEPTIVVIINRIAVTRLNDKQINACFPNTVELPQQKAANKENNAAMSVLLSPVDIGLLPNVTRQPPIIAQSANTKYRFDSFSLRTIAAKETAKRG